MLPAGTRQSLNDNSLVSEAHQPPFEYFAPTVRPAVPDGTMIEEISGLPPDLPVIASTVIAEVIEVPEFVMKALLPLMIHSPPASPCPFSRRAVVRMPPGMSEPPPGSVRPKAASRSPLQRSGSHWARCSSLPYR